MKFNPCKLYPSLPYFVQDRAPWNWKTLESSWAAHSPVAMSLYLGIKQSKWWDGVGRSHWSMCFCRCLRRHFSIFNLMGMFLKIVDFSFVFFGAIWAKHRWMHWHNVCLKRHLDAFLAKCHVFHLGERNANHSRKSCAILSRQDQAFEEAGEGPLFTVNWLTFSCGLWFRCRAEHHRTWAISVIFLSTFCKVQEIPTQCMI